MTDVDGNALAGVLGDLFAGDPTMMRAECAGCGESTMIAELTVTLDDRGAVARCPHCTIVMLDIRESRLDVRGIRALRPGL
jgi:DNA-directed RNA polymerase subunit RPC12/RpoP